MSGQKRLAISKKTRFEVFKRDSFKCQYCGKSAPDVVLHVDHINPVSKGGKNDILNLITSCEECNLGKSDVLLDDDAAIAKQRAQLEQLNERREQLEMMVKWRDGLNEIKNDTINSLAEYIERNMPGFYVNERGKKSVGAWLRKYTFIELCEAVDKAADRYLGEVTPEAVESYFKAIDRFAGVAKLPHDDQRILYIRGILRNRLPYVNETAAIKIMREAVRSGVHVEEIESLAKAARHWTEFVRCIEDMQNG